MKKLMLLLVLCSFTVSAQISIAPYPVRVKNTATASYDPYQFLYSGDSLKLWYHRTISGDRFTGTLRARSLGKAETNICTGFEMVTKGNDSVLVGAYTQGDGSFRVKERRVTGSASKDVLIAWYDSLVTNTPIKIVGSAATATTSANTSLTIQDTDRGEGRKSRIQNISGTFDITANTYRSAGGAGGWSLDDTTAGGTRLAINSGTNITVNFMSAGGNPRTSTEYFRFSTTGLGVRTTSTDAYLRIGAGTAAAGTAPIKFTNGTLLSTPEVGAVEMNGDSLYFTGTTGTRKALALGGGGSGGGGTAGGWVRTTFIRTDTAGVKVYVAGSLDDTTTYSSLFNVGGTSSFGNDVLFYTDWYYQATKIFENADTSFVNVTFKGNPITTAYIDATLTDKNIDGTSYFTGSRGVNTAGNLVATGYADVEDGLILGEAESVDGVITFYRTPNTNWTQLFASSTGNRTIYLPDASGTMNTMAFVDSTKYHGSASINTVGTLTSGAINWTGLIQSTGNVIGGTLTAGTTATLGGGGSDGSLIVNNFVSGEGGGDYTATLTYGGSSNIAIGLPTSAGTMNTMAYVDSTKYHGSASINTVGMLANGGISWAGTITTTSTITGGLLVGESTAGTDQMRLKYDVDNYTAFLVNSSGELTVTPTGINNPTTTFAQGTGVFVIGGSSPQLQVGSTGAGDIAMRSAGNGYLTLATSSSASNFTATFPAASGTVAILTDDTLASSYLGTWLNAKKLRGASDINISGDIFGAQGRFKTTGGNQVFAMYNDAVYSTLNTDASGDLEIFTTGTDVLISGTQPFLTLGNANGQTSFKMRSASTGYGIIRPASSASDYTLTLPAETGTIGLLDAGQNFTNIGSLTATGRITTTVADTQLVLKYDADSYMGFYVDNTSLLTITPAVATGGVLFETDDVWIQPPVTVGATTLIVSGGGLGGDYTGEVYLTSATHYYGRLLTIATSQRTYTFPDRTGTVLVGSAVNSVSPTSPNRTITINIDGTLYYIHAKTTND